MKTITKKVRAPVRVDFAGGTTDIYPFTHTHGGAVLNCGIQKYIVGKLSTGPSGVGLEYHGDIPTSSGLGTSGVMNLIWLALISQIKKIKKKGILYESKLELAEKVYRLEQAIGLIGGKQDQYAASLGGINFIEFNKDKVKVTRLDLPKHFIKKLEDKLVLVYTGKPHFSGQTNKSMMDNLRKGKNTKNLMRLKEIAYEMKNALLKEDLERFAELMNQETGERKKLHYSIVPPHLERFIQTGLENGAIAAKVCGSGGGGSILFFGDKEKLKKKFGNKIIDFKFDFDGLTWI